MFYFFQNTSHDYRYSIVNVLTIVQILFYSPLEVQGLDTRKSPNPVLHLCRNDDQKGTLLASGINKSHKELGLDCRVNAQAQSSPCLQFWL